MRLAFGILFAALSLGTLPKADAQPLRSESVEGCPEWGVGYMRLAGTDACLRIGGELTTGADRDFGEEEIFLQSDYRDGVPFATYRADPAGAEFSELRTSVDAELDLIVVSQTEYGPLAGVVQLRGAVLPDGVNEVTLGHAFVQVGGFTAGLHPSFFDFSTGFTQTPGYASDAVTPLFAFTYELRPTVTITVSAENGVYRRVQEGVWAQYGGADRPDIVGSGRVAQDWGLLHAAAAAHRIEDLRGDRSWGWAANAGLEYRTSSGEMPGRLLLSASYADGAIGYLGIPFYVADYIVDEGGRIARTRGYSLLASYEQVWTPRLKSSATLSYYGALTETSFFDWRVRGLTATVGSEFMPVPGLMMGVELSWYYDVLQGTELDVSGPRESVSTANVLTYLRRQF